AQPAPVESEHGQRNEEMRLDRNTQPGQRPHQDRVPPAAACLDAPGRHEDEGELLALAEFPRQREADEEGKGDQDRAAALRRKRLRQQQQRQRGERGGPELYRQRQAYHRTQRHRRQVDQEGQREVHFQDIAAVDRSAGHRARHPGKEGNVVVEIGAKLRRDSHGENGGGNQKRPEQNRALCRSFPATIAHPHFPRVTPQALSKPGRDRKAAPLLERRRHSNTRRAAYRVTGKPRRLSSAFTSGSRPRNARYASARSVSLPAESRVSRKRSAVALSQGLPASSNAAQVTASITSDQR